MNKQEADDLLIRIIEQLKAAQTDMQLLISQRGDPKLDYANNKVLLAISSLQEIRNANYH